MTQYVASGFFTPDYAHWLVPLTKSLDAVGAPHDFLPMAKRAGGREVNTLLKPKAILLSMERNPGESIILFGSIILLAVSCARPQAVTIGTKTTAVLSVRRSGLL